MYKGPKLGKPEREAFQGKRHVTLGSYSERGIMSTVVEVLKLPSRASRQGNRKDRKEGSGGKASTEG